jgi:hypothetical protein
MAKKKYTFIGGMDQDTSKSKRGDTKYYKGTNIKVLTEEGLSSGNIENEDGNLLSFDLPDTLGFWKIRFDNPENPDYGKLSITYNSTIYSTGNVNSIEDLYAAMLTALSNLATTDYKLIRNGEFIYLIPLTSAISTIVGDTTVGNDGLSTNTGTYEVEPQTDLRIIGWTTLRDEVIVFSTNETSATPNSAGQIWKFSYDPITKIINNIGANSTLTLADHLIYNNKLNFSTHWHIGTEAVGHYENSKTGRVYWTDEYNNLRTINALDPNLLGFSPGDLDINSQLDMSIPILDRVSSNGSLPDGATVQYSYRLFNVGGGSTVFSPVTNPIPLGKFDPTSNSAGNRPFEADGDTTSSGNKSVTYNISNIDTSYNYIEHIAIVRVGSATSIYKFDEEAVPSDGNLEVTHTDKGDDIPITPEEFAFLTRTFKRCKTITIKDKRLIAANLDTLDTTVDGWDSRAYRFNSSYLALLNDKELSSITLDNSGANTPAYASVPEEHDVINPYNKEPHLASDGNPNTVNQYKFQEDGVTLGGSGLNVSYKFVTEEVSLKATVSGAGSSGYSVDGNYNTIHYNRFNAAPYNNSGYVSLNGEDRVAPGEYQSFLSPAMVNTFKGYARGETYRMGIVFYDLTGNPYNVKWIGDIKVPEATEKVSGNYPYSVTGDNISDSNLYDGNYPIKGKSIGVEFTVDVSDLLGKVSGYEIVRVERKTQDRSRLGTGIMTNFGLTNGTYGGRRSFAKTGGIYASNKIPLLYTATGFQDTDQINVASTGTKATAIINDAPVFFNTGGLRTMAIISPNSILRRDSGYSYKSGDTVRTLGFYRDMYEAGTLYQKRNANDFNGDADKLVAGYNILGRAWNTSDACQESREITQEEQMGMADVISSGWNGPAGLGVTHFANCSPATTGEDDPAGVGGQKQVIDINDRFEYYSASNSLAPWISSSNPLQTIANAGAYTPKADTTPINSYWWREISYDRTLANQYGGDTYEARSGNEYISTGTYEQLKEYYNSSRTITAYGGDVFVTMFHYQFYETNYTSLNKGNFGVNDYKYHLGFAMPCESPINCDYLDSGHYADKSDTDWLKGSNSCSDSSNGSTCVGEAVYSLGDHYRYDNNVKKIFYPPDFIDNLVEEHPHRIWASETKLDGELLDSWRVWLVNNYTEVEGQYGEINKITTIKDRFLFYQDRAFGTASINDRSVINDENGVALTVGSGGILDDYGYISRNTGTKHKFSVVPSGAAVHHFDGILKKWMQYTGGAMPLSDIKGLHSHFLGYNSSLLSSDRILNGAGIHGVFDRVRNKVYMTFLGAKQVIQAGGDISLDSVENFTICFNEAIQAYESFSSCVPSLWLETDGKLLTVARQDETSSVILPGGDADLSFVDPRNKGYLHYEGEKNNYYGIVYPSTLEIILNPAQDLSTVFDSIEYKGEMFINDIDQSTLTLDTIQAVNDHQDSGVINLTVGNNVIRKLRSWRTNIPRDTYTNSPRMRDYFIKLVLTHTPDNNERMVLHDIILNFRPSPN